ncbi:hypothetical protein EVAR_85822_1 [Eumeta japonica]|uniref:Uncharacterized protein n=1 Tax=Eumeta variegata TaxID=151549 RepID=A0A4C1UQ83_EUMVA|nr:hypothetical protein EVAR_85822_1 [Eumeta japonica]
MNARAGVRASDGFKPRYFTSKPVDFQETVTSSETRPDHWTGYDRLIISNYTPTLCEESVTDGGRAPPRLGAGARAVESFTV